MPVTVTLTDEEAALLAAAAGLSACHRSLFAVRARRNSPDASSRLQQTAATLDALAAKLTPEETPCSTPTPSASSCT